MLKKLNKSDKGFTIIEVMIVLVIAALILLIVFLAVPALQRNSRNTNRKSDVQRLLASIAEYQGNNNGSPSTRICGSANPYTIIGGASCPGTGAGSEVKLGYYTPTAGAHATGAQNALSSDIVVIVSGAKCDPANDGKTQGGSSRQFAVQYMFEPNSTLTATCADS